MYGRYRLSRRKEIIEHFEIAQWDDWSARFNIEAEPDLLKGWQQIAAFLGQPVSVAQRWANDGMPVRKQGRYVETTRAELNRWLGRESAGEPVQVATLETDLSAELKRGLSFVPKQGGKRTEKAA